ncbi:MAG TPA: TetR family transcriptional regulator [Terriglobia bacterium]|nr:TetR family transcriptional regulator [Terriglobia bacterium]
MRRRASSAVAGRRERAAETRAAILAAAERIFAERGLAGARTDAIAARAGVNKALLYYYFKDKDALYLAVLDDQFSEFHRQAMQVLESEGSARSVLLRYVSLHLDFIGARHRFAPLFQQMMMTGGKPFERLVRKYFAPRAEALGRLIERGMREGEFRRGDREHVAVSVVALIVFYFSSEPVMRMLGRRDAFSAANLKRRKREVLDFIRYGLFLRPEASVA